MLSILIPVFNFDVRELVKELHQQCLDAQIPFEILGYDDGSKEAFRLLTRQIDLPYFRYKVMDKNIGRSAIRNRLAKDAKYDQLLFMDCDSKIISEKYIQHYLDHLSEAILLYGGRTYSETPPENLQYLLHWYFGKNREAIPARERAVHPYHSFMTNNFLISKSVFSTVQFNESIKQYGHEDTLFGLELKKQNISILHIDNPLEHIGLETTTAFLYKNRLAIENLLQLSKDNSEIETKLLSTSKKLGNWNLEGVVFLVFRLFESMLLKNLHSPNPKMWCLDFYKLGVLVRLKRV